jgi:hypothetical protein
MRKAIKSQSQFATIQSAVASDASARSSGCTWPSLGLRATAVTLIAVAAFVRAQTPAAQPPAPASPSAQKPAHQHKHPGPVQPQVAPDPATTAPVAPPEPETPKWPAFDHPAEASVVWDSQGLRIDAQNSSLQQILKDVSTATGAKVDGLNSDERVFGAFGPGQARDILSQLLQGSGYNIVMIGDLGQGAPRQILLSTRQAVNAQPAPRSTPNISSDEDDSDDQPPPQEQAPMPMRNFPPGTPPRTPQQIMQEMQQRQQQNQQNQQNQQPGQPFPQPQN